MARIRTVKPEFFTSPDTARASMEARLLYIAMWCWADDYGIGEANMLALRAFAFPEEDHYLSKEIQSLCKEVADCYGVVFYTNKNRRFYEIPSWDEHQKTQRRAKGRNPSANDPDSSPDQRFSVREGTSESLQGTSERTQGKTPLGTGNIGTGNREQGTTSSEPASQVPTKKKPPYPPEFEHWWTTYPRRRNASKKDAAKQWAEATKTIDPAELLRLTASYAENPGVDDARYIPHPQKWLRDRRWESIDETNNHVNPEPTQQGVTAGALLASFYGDTGNGEPEQIGGGPQWQLGA